MAVPTTTSSPLDDRRARGRTWLTSAFRIDGFKRPDPGGGRQPAARRHLRSRRFGPASVRPAVLRADAEARLACRDPGRRRLDDRRRRGPGATPEGAAPDLATVNTPHRGWPTVSRSPGPRSTPFRRRATPSEDPGSPGEKIAITVKLDRRRTGNQPGQLSGSTSRQPTVALVNIPKGRRRRRPNSPSPQTSSRGLIRSPSTGAGQCHATMSPDATPRSRGQTNVRGHFPFQSAHDRGRPTGQPRRWISCRAAMESARDGIRDVGRSGLRMIVPAVAATVRREGLDAP